MTINFDYEVTEEFEFDFEEMEKKVVEACVDFVDCPYETEVNILLTNDEQIRVINKEYREVDAPTDVLSFPGVDYDTPGDFSRLEEEVASYFHPETGELLLGDIVISLERAKQQAKEYGHSLKRELAFLTTHSMFHLFGYDHMEEEERKLMEDKQREVLEGLQILR
jgi:probable rRNA maturation factor